MIRIVEDDSNKLILYRGYKSSIERYNDLINDFKPDSNGEKDFGYTPYIASGYGHFGIQIILDRDVLNLKTIEPYCSNEELEKARVEGYDGVIHLGQYYIFNLNKLNSNITSKCAYKLNNTNRSLEPAPLGYDYVCDDEPSRFGGWYLIKGSDFNKNLIKNGYSKQFDDREYVPCIFREDEFCPVECTELIGSYLDSFIYRAYDKVYPKLYKIY